MFKISCCQLIRNVRLVSAQFALRFNSNLTLSQQKYVESLFDGLVSNKRADLAKSITLIETSNPVKKLQAELLLDKVLKRLKENRISNAKTALRIGLCLN